MQNFLEPGSVAFIGASRKTGTGAYNGVEMMLRYGYKGRIYPINPQAGEICGLRAFSSVADLPEPVDLAIISVGRDHVVPAFSECIRCGIKSVVIISQGFSDADEKGSALQAEIVRMARGKGVRVLGPNTMGMLNNFKKFWTGFIDIPAPEEFPPVTVVAQTGLVQVAYPNLAYQSWGKAIDIGNACDVDFVDALEYLGDDPETKVIVFHMEGVLRGKEFLEVASRVSFEKPVVVLKTGRSKAGAEAALSHTGSLVGEDEVNDAAFDRAGIIRVKSTVEMRDAIKALLRFGEMGGTRLGVITATGAGGIMATDACEDYGLTLGRVPEGLPALLTKGMPDWIHVGNPVDIWPIGMIGHNYPQVLHATLVELLKSPEFDGVMGIVPNFNSPLHADMSVVDAVREARRQAGNDKPVALWVYGESASAERELESIDGVACFESIEQAVRGLSFCSRYHRIRQRKIPRQRSFSYGDAAVEALLRGGRAKKTLLGKDALGLLSEFGIPTVLGRTAGDRQGVEEAAESIGYPVVLKLYGDAFLHKSEWGGVVTGIRNKKELWEAMKRITERVRSRDSRVEVGFEVQKQVSGKELLLGLKRDPGFGLVLVCGFGGIYTEVFRDIARRLVPVDRREAEEMLRSLKCYPLLTGVRGERGVDIEGLLDVLERLSFLATRVPGIAELDINPLMADAAGCVAVDARVIF